MQSINKSVCIIDRFVFRLGLLQLTAVELPTLASELLIKGEDIRGVSSILGFSIYLYIYIYITARIVLKVITTSIT